MPSWGFCHSPQLISALHISPIVRWQQSSPVHRPHYSLPFPESYCSSIHVQIPGLHGLALGDKVINKMRNIFHKDSVRPLNPWISDVHPWQQSCLLAQLVIISLMKGGPSKCPILAWRCEAHQGKLNDSVVTGSESSQVLHIADHPFLFSDDQVKYTALKFMTEPSRTPYMLVKEAVIQSI